MIRRRSPAVVVLALALTLVSGACAGDDGSAAVTTPSDDGPTTTTEAATSGPTATNGTDDPVIREILAELVDPPGAAGNTLSLVRYTIAPGAQLPAHIHPGVQMAAIESGQLTYTVESGTALVRRAGTDADEPVEGPTTIQLDQGDAVTELADMVHFGANDTDAPIVIMATLLTVSGEDLAVTVDEPDGTTTDA